MRKSMSAERAVYVVDGCRTPFLKARSFGPFSAADLAVSAGSALLNRQNFSPELIDEVIIGSAMPGPDEANIARVIALRLGCGIHVPGYTVMRNCASGMQALDNASMSIAMGRADLVIAGGTDAMSRAPLLLNDEMSAWLGSWFSAKTATKKLALLPKLRPQFFAPIIALLRGLTDPIYGINMGQTAEELAYDFNISREAMDAYAAESHKRAAKSLAHADEIVPLIDSKGRVYSVDDGIRPDVNQEQLAKLKPFFDKKYGMVTAGNSSQITDGACLLLLASIDAVKKYHLPVLGKIVDTAWSGCMPTKMGLGPVYAATSLLSRHNLSTQAIDAWEINEAFAAQVLACFMAFDDANFCQKNFALDAALGAPSYDRFNAEGGAIALGHPIGASGARIVLRVLKDLKRNNTKKGIAAICIGGGQGGAMYLESVKGA
jgi:acetyl-CoA C-acetyltransferase